MDEKTKIKAACAFANMSLSDLARRLGSSPQLLNSRIKTGKFTLDEWEKIADAMGCRWVGQFVFDDGTTI